MTKASIKEENIILNNMYASNTDAPKYTKQILIGIKGKMENNAIIVGDFNIPFTSMEWSLRKKNQYDNSGLKWHNKSLEKIDVYMTSHWKKADTYFFFQRHMAFSLE